MNRRIDGYSLDKRFLRQDGTLLYASVSTRCVRRPNGVVDYFVAVVQDITERKQAEEHIQHLAHFDVLTGLPNRALLGDRLEQAVLRALRDRVQVGCGIGFRSACCWWIWIISSGSTIPWAIPSAINCCGKSPTG